MRRRYLRALAALAALVFPGLAGAQCSVGPQTASVTVPGQLAVYYLEFRSMPELDQAEFYGGVCVTAVGGEWTVVADEVTLSGLTAELALRAEHPQLLWGDMRMTAALLAATTDLLVLQDATVAAPDFSGTAAMIALDITTGAMSLSGFTLAGVAFAVSGESAELVGQTLTVTGPAVTTCIGMEEAPYAIEGLSATVGLATRSVDLRGGVLRLGALRVGLRPRITLSEESLERFTLPLRVQNVSDGGDPARPGTGVGVRLVDLPIDDEGAASLDVGATGLDSEHPLGVVALVRVAEEEVGRELTAVVGLEAGLPVLDVRLTREAAPWLDATFSLHSGAEQGAVAYHEGKAQLDASFAVPLSGSPTLTVGAEAFAAATALVSVHDLATPQAFGARLGGAVRLQGNTGATAFGALGLTARAEATWYPQQDALQWGVRLAPTWRLTAAPLTLQLGYDTWLTNSASPFPGIDRREPLQRLTGSARVAGELARTSDGSVVTGRVSLAVTHDGVPVGGQAAGFRSAVTAAGIAYQTGDWTIDGSVTAQLAGALDPATGRDASLTYALEGRRAGWPVLVSSAEGPVLPHGDLTLRAEAVQGLLPTGPGLRRLELSVGAPLAFERFELRPVVGFDVAPLLLHGLAPVLSVHGLELTLVTCCGALTVGYSNLRGEWTASFAVDLERRPPKAKRAALP